MNRQTEMGSWGARAGAVLRRRYSRVRHRVPARAVRTYSAARSKASGLRRAYAKPLHVVEYENLFHCTMHKSGSQWIQSVLSDFAVYRYTGLAHYHYQSRLGESRPVGERSFIQPFPERTIVSPLYIGYEEFKQLPKAGDYRGFFVMRDPRDLMVSWYFSAMGSHVLREPNSRLARLRGELAQLSREDGLRKAIDFWREQGRFAALASWAQVDDPRMRLIRYEDLTGLHGPAGFHDLFTFLGIPMPDDTRERLLRAYSFQRLSGRKPGDADARSHLRTGRGGGWREYLTDPILEHLAAASGGLVEQLGYQDA